MHTQQLFLIFASLTTHLPAVAGFVMLHKRSPGSSPRTEPLQIKRQPISPPDQTLITRDVPAPGQQTQNTTSTEGAGNGTDPEPGVITNTPTTTATNEIDCKNITTGRGNKCWSQLNLTKWVEDWVDYNACHSEEPFASYFLMLEGFPGLDCTGVKISACTSPQGDHLLKEPEVFYVAYNIYGEILSASCVTIRQYRDLADPLIAVNQFFLSWWTAVGNSASVASDNVDQIVQLLDPLSDANTVLDDVLLTLTGVFALVPGLGYLAKDIKGFTEG